jgi:transposase
MAYREVTVLEVKEVLRQWAAGIAKKRIAAQLGLDVKTVRRYVEAAAMRGLVVGAHADDAIVAAVVEATQPKAGRPVGDGWTSCEAQRDFIARHLDAGVRLSKTWKLLGRSGVDVTYATLRRYAIAELGFGRTAPTIPVADCEPGAEVQLDTGWMTLLEPDLFRRRRRFRAWIFTAVRSRHRFVWPVFQETTATAIEACEAAWDFYGGIFRAVIVDNTKTIVTTADPLAPVLNAAFLEYAQARGFVIDTARVRSPRDKGRVERTVQTVRDDCFAGERIHTIEAARERARRWCIEEYGRRRHSRTLRMPLEHFEAEERAALLPPPTATYDLPLWCEPKIGRDQHAQVAKALYSLPTKYVGRTLRARADRSVVTFYDGAVLVKTHARVLPGRRSTDPNDFPREKTTYALRDVAFLQQQAAGHGEAIGRYAAALLAGDLPWTRMRRVYRLLSLVKRYGGARVDASCATALAADLVNVHRLERLVKLAVTSEPPRVATVIPIARYLRPASQYALPLHRPQSNEGDPQ